MTDIIRYVRDADISVAQFADLLHRSGLAERRPVNNEACLAGMLKYANLTISVWQGEMLLGIARAVTDFHYACYLSDLAVCKSQQQRGIGIELQRHIQAALEPTCKIILLAAPAAHDYYAHIGYTHHPRAWIINQDDSIG